ncbi:MULTISPECIES: FAD:protein FMN transferase [unclassified Streptomyces]|uniref:FAD:protein FMN transferase n=1 Tax=unclassified Streptomyces TaxID=2593676 RepID=UPI000F496446|nr:MULTISPECIES: FAD:protein FMN transferase [unclassified Streptomyces]MCX4768762.1 FAD:protein FMN transferase [Streptomyces sp. NBC_01285]ROQ77105.1 thiamine biosynthesis lipoprotein [Streptomyces sp. CEV 2-1]
MPDAARGLRHVEHVMGTVFSFDIRDEPTAAIHGALAEAVGHLHHVDAAFSTYRPDSHISRLDRGEIRLADCPPEVHEVLSLCALATRDSDGWFSIAPAGALDPSGLVKGWATEAASQLLYDAGAHHTCVNGGGDLQLRGQAAPGVPWSIGVAHPLRPGELATVVTAHHDLAVATSGTAERGTHIFHPYHGTPVTPFASLTVIGPRLTMTDAYATAAFARGDGARDWLETLDGYEGLAVLPDGEEWRTPGFSQY